MFHVELAPLGGILGPLKSDLGVFWAKIPLYPYNVKFSKSIFSKSANLPILSFWILNLHIIICQFQKRSTVKHFFFSQSMLLPHVVVTFRKDEMRLTAWFCDILIWNINTDLVSVFFWLKPSKAKIYFDIVPQLFLLDWMLPKESIYIQKAIPWW